MKFHKEHLRSTKGGIGAEKLFHKQHVGIVGVSKLTDELIERSTAKALLSFVVVKKTRISGFLIPDVHLRVRRAVLLLRRKMRKEHNKRKHNAKTYLGHGHGSLLLRLGGDGLGVLEEAVEGPQEIADKAGHEEGLGRILHTPCFRGVDLCAQIHHPHYLERA